MTTRQRPSLRPGGDHPERALAVTDLPRAAAILDRIAADIDELARAQRVQDLNTAAVLPDPRSERRRRLAEPDLEFRAFCTPAAAARILDPATEAGLGCPAGRAGTSAARSANGRLRR